MGLYENFETVITFANLISFIYIRIYKFGMIIQSSHYAGFDEDLFV